MGNIVKPKTETPPTKDEKPKRKTRSKPTHRLRRLELGFNIHVHFSDSFTEDWENFKVEKLKYRAYKTGDPLNPLFNSAFYEKPITEVIGFRPTNQDTPKIFVLMEREPFTLWFKDPTDALCFEVVIDVRDTSVCDNYFAIINHSGHWHKIDATLQNRSVKFKCFPIEKFFLIRQPHQQPFRVTAEGVCVKSVKEEGILIFFPQNIVTNEERITLVVKDRNQYATEGIRKKFGHNKFIKMSHVLEINRNPGFRRSFEVQLPVTDIDSEMKDEKLPSIHRLIAFACNRGRVVGIIPQPKYQTTEEPGCYIIQINDYRTFKGIAVALVLHDVINLVTTLEAEVALGLRYLCCIMVFAQYKDERHHLLRVTCVQYDLVRTALEECGEGWTEIKDQRINDVIIDGNGRIRLVLRGNIVLHDGADADILLFNFSPNLTNQVSFPIFLSDAYGGNREIVINIKHEWPTNTVLGSVYLTHVDLKRLNKRMRQRAPSRTTEYDDKETMFDDEGIFSSRSIVVLAQQLTPTDMYALGRCLNISNPALERLKEDTIGRSLEFGCQLLTEWKMQTKLKSTEDMFDELLNALQNVERNDIVHALRNLDSLDKNLQKDFLE